MSRNRLIVAGSIVLLVSIGVVVVVAQSHPGRIGMHGGKANHHEKMVEHLTDRLNLSDEQKTKVEQIVADAKPRFTEIHTRLATAHKESMDLGISGVYDNARAEAAATRQADIIKQALIEMEKTKAAIFAVLTEEQRGQARKLMGDMVESFIH